MPPKQRDIEEALKYGTYEVFKADPDATSVNKVRQHVELKLSLEEGFFSDEEWKQKSKEIIKECVVCATHSPHVSLTLTETG